MPTIAIIPARGGSKRIPQKNLRDFCGKPIISYPIRTAIDSGVFSRVFVTTDSVEIAQIGQEYGAEVPFLRSAEASSDTATTQEAIVEMLQKLEVSDDTEICCIYPCTPLITPKLIFNTYKNFARDASKFLFTATKFSHPVQRGFEISDGAVGSGVPLSEVRTQDVHEYYHDAGQLYWATGKVWQSESRIVDRGSRVELLSTSEAIDIDSEQDWLLAEQIFRGKQMER
jgi:N-acylneuraminate cytidylyltransferase